MNRPEPMPILPSGTADAMLDALPHPVFMVGADDRVANANGAAEAFFEASLPMLRRHTLGDLVPFGSPLLALIDKPWIGREPKPPLAGAKVGGFCCPAPPGPRLPPRGQLVAGGFCCPVPPPTALT